MEVSIEDDIMYQKVLSNVHDLVNDGLINIKRYESTLHALLGFTEDTPVKKCIVPITRYAFMEGEPSDINQFYCTDDDGNGEWKDGLETSKYIKQKYMEDREYLDYVQNLYKNMLANKEIYLVAIKATKSDDPFVVQDYLDRILDHYGLKNPMDEVEKDDVVLRSMDLDMSFVEERGKGVIEENEVLVRGEWKQEIEEKKEEEQEEGEEEEEEEEQEEEEEEEEEETGHPCSNCNKKNVKFVCSRCKTVWYCSRECQVQHWKQHKKDCKEKVKVDVKSVKQEPSLPKQDELMIKPPSIIEKKIDSVKTVVMERQYDHDVHAEEIKEVPTKPKRKSLFRQNFERNNEN